MSKWEALSFDDVFLDDTKNGVKIKKEKYLDEGLHPVIDQGQNFISGYINSSEGLYTNIPAIIFGDHTRIIKYIDIPFFLGADGVKLLKSKMENISYKYLYYFLVKNEVPNTGYNRHFKWLKELKVPLPPLETQKQIAKILDTAAELLAMRKQQLAELDNLIKSVFYEMFGDPVTNEKGWKAEAGSQIYVFSSGKFNRSHQLDDSYEYPCYGGNGIIGRSKEYLIDYQTLVIGRVGAYCGSIHLTSQKSWITDNAIYLKQYDKSKFELEFLKMLFTELNFNRFADFSGQPKITQKPLLELSYICPPRSLQTKFATIVTRIEEQKSLVKKGLDETQYLFDSLMAQYFD
ncbi:restriction endonuclease subunit S [Brevibacillus parabrevis]|uniref:restriction endonuclease subunit S n=1 Tax=Brevibacillus parabrevis TaxID=54914 RepID=UPI0028D18C46|nr:restriction endonuclease subunit S [Brevibacillus parabrevis]